MTYRDRGFAERAIGYCVDQTDLTREAYLTQHLQEWQSVWARAGLTPGENLLEAYQQFLQEPDRLQLKMTPTPTFDPGLLAQRPPLEWLGFLEINVAVNDRESVLVNLHAEPGSAIPPENSTTPAPMREAPSPVDTSASLPPPVSSEPERTPVPVSRLGEYINEPVQLIMRDGRELSGRIQGIERQWLQLQRYQSGGYYIQPVRLEDIAQAQIP